jgi:hypothetical protein
VVSDPPCSPATTAREERAIVEFLRHQMCLKQVEVQQLFRVLDLEQRVLSDI